MQKVQVFLRKDQKAALESMAARTGQKQSALIRKSVDLFLRDSAGRDEDWRDATRAAVGIWKDRDDLDVFSKDLRERSKKRFARLYDVK